MNSYIEPHQFKWNTWAVISDRVSTDNSKSQWNREVFAEAQATLDAIPETLDPGESINMLSHFLFAFQTYRQLDHDIESLLYGGMRGSTRVRSLLIPLCSSLIEGCYTNLAKALMVPLSRVNNKDYGSQKDLQPLMDILKANGFSKLSDIPNIGLRNAMSHGGVMIKEGTTGCRIEYTYTRGKDRLRGEMNSGELESIVLSYLDAVSGLILALCKYFDRTDALENVPNIEDEYIRLMYIGFEISDSDCICLDAFEAPLNSQLSYAFSTKQVDTESLFEVAEKLLANLRISCPNYDSYGITFAHQRIPGNFLRADKSAVDNFIRQGNPRGELIRAIKESGDILWFGANTEEIDEFEAEYFRFPILNTDTLKIFDLSDASLDDRKRLKANVFIGDVSDKNTIAKLVTEAVDWVKSLYNPPNLSTAIKHGSMDADCVYLNVYKTIYERDRSLLQTNDNFICQIEYCPNNDFRLRDNNGFISYLYRNSEWKDDATRFLWRERKYLTITNENKVGRNALCPCGSGKKYKKCCGR